MKVKFLPLAARVATLLFAATAGNVFSAAELPVVARTFNSMEEVTRFAIENSCGTKMRSVPACPTINSALVARGLPAVEGEAFQLSGEAGSASRQIGCHTDLPSGSSSCCDTSTTIEQGRFCCYVEWGSWPWHSGCGVFKRDH